MESLLLNFALASYAAAAAPVVLLCIYQQQHSAFLIMLMVTNLHKVVVHKYLPSALPTFFNNSAAVCSTSDGYCALWILSSFYEHRGLLGIHIHLFLGLRVQFLQILQGANKVLDPPIIQNMAYF